MSSKIHCFIDQITNIYIPNSHAQIPLRHTLSVPPSVPPSTPPSFLTRSTSPISIRSHLEGFPPTVNQAPRRAGKKVIIRRASFKFAQHSQRLLIAVTRCDVGQVTSIDTLPDDVLLEIFAFYLYNDQVTVGRGRGWQLLVHVCRRWRGTVFGYPRHLNLQLVCADRTRARDMLDVWPAFPLIIDCGGGYQTGNVDNITAALERSDRVCQISLTVTRNSDLEIFLAAMQQPFPELTRLELESFNQSVLVVPDSFLDGSAPCLEYLVLRDIPFPGLPKLLLSATHLVNLTLRQIPHSGYFSPDAMVAALSTLNHLESLNLSFQSPRSFPDQATRPPPPLTRSVLPVLREFWFKGVSEYLEDFVALIDTPQLNELSLKFFSDFDFDTPQLIQFISRSPTSRAFEKAHITLWDGAAYVKFLSQTSGHAEVIVEILRRGLDLQFLSLEQVFTSFLPPLSTLEDLYIYKRPGWPLVCKDNIENWLWLVLLHPFTGVKNLYLCDEFARRIAPALQGLAGGRMTVVLPDLHNMFLEMFKLERVQEGIVQFVNAREAAGHTIAYSWWVSSEREKISTYYYD